MAQFSVNPHCFDPHKQFKFRVKWDGKYVPGICQVSGLKRTTQIISHREGGEPSTVRLSPGPTTYEPIVLVRGRTHDAEFERWADKVWSHGSGLGAEVSLQDFRKDVTIELYNEAGQKVMSFQVYRCWPSEYVALGELDAGRRCDTARAGCLHRLFAEFCRLFRRKPARRLPLESITLQHEGWERDHTVTEPADPSYHGAPG